MNDIRTIPTNKPVRVRTATGIVCRAITYPIGETTRWIRRASKGRPYDSVNCYRLRDDNSIRGEVVAVAWEPL